MLIMNEKDFFTQKRKEQLNRWPELSVLEQWGKYFFVPLNIPKIENPQLVDWYFKNCKPTYKLEKDIANPFTNVSAFDSIDVIPHNEEQHDIWSLNLKPEFMIEFKDVYDQLLEYFPFKKINRIRLWSSTSAISYHRDHTRFVDFPGAFRIMLYDENPQQTLGIMQSDPEESFNFKQRFLIPRLPDTNSYVWNNLRSKHGSTYSKEFKKILIILDRYELDVPRYEELMKKSIDKYQDYSFIDNKEIKHYINL